MEASDSTATAVVAGAEATRQAEATDRDLDRLVAATEALML